MRQARNAYPEMSPALKMKAERNAEVMGVALDSPEPIKSEQCVDIMILADLLAPKDCSCLTSGVHAA
ncbi:hypothetical protein D6B98_29760 [Bradyrhizobium sp. LVM 105]|nr:hypothetical protein D6B98_29760 [Bradyrhizobium sp. LVM 105]